MQKINSRKCNNTITFSGKITLNFFINLILYFFINFILNFTLGGNFYEIVEKKRKKMETRIRE